MLYEPKTTHNMSERRRARNIADLPTFFPSTSTSSKYNPCLSPTSTLSSGYESGCSESEIDDIFSSVHHHPLPSSRNENEYFELESDQYVCLGKPTYNSLEESNSRLQRVRESMINIITDLESLGYETSLDKLSHAVRSSVKLNKGCTTPTSSPQQTKKTKSLQKHNKNNKYTKSPVDQLFTEIGQYQDAGSKVRLYDSLITNLALECSNDRRAQKDDPIYEEIYDDYDFDIVSHSDSYRKTDTPPALPPRATLPSRRTCPPCSLPPRSTRSLEPPTRAARKQPQRCTSIPCLTEVQKVTWRDQCGKSRVWHSISV